MVAKINIATIADEVLGLVEKYDEREPEKLAQNMKIIVDHTPMGLFAGCCKGFFIVHRRMKHITINSDLPDELQRVVLAHELGHAVLHAKTGTVSQFHETTLFDSANTLEYEANLFASELLLTDEDVLNALNEDAFFFQAARTLYVPAEMLDFKFRVMKRKGYKLESPVMSQSDFMKRLEQGFAPEDQE